MSILFRVLHVWEDLEFLVEYKAGSFGNQMMMHPTRCTEPHSSAGLIAGSMTISYLSLFINHIYPYFIDIYSKIYKTTERA